jgi:hypothetical protein
MSSTHDFRTEWSLGTPDSERRWTLGGGPGPRPEGHFPTSTPALPHPT